MRTALLHVIRAVKTTSAHTVRVVYNDGEIRDVDFRSAIEKGGIFSPLADPDFFAQVQVSEDGRYIMWPGDLDFCADAIRAGDRVPTRT